MERFAGLNIHDSNPMKLSWKYFHGALASSIIKKRCLYSDAYFIMSYVHLSNCICCFHKYQAIWERNRLLQRIDNTNEPNVVRTMKERKVMGHAYVPCKISGCMLFLELVDISSVHAVTGDRCYSCDPYI